MNFREGERKKEQCNNILIRKILFAHFIVACLHNFKGLFIISLRVPQLKYMGPGSKGVVIPGNTSATPIIPP
jgi:hypothetical protein